MDTNINPVEGEASPTQPADMSTTNQTPAADQQPKVAEAKPAEVLFAEEALGRTFDSKEEAQKALKNLNSMVGDQTLAKQRKALEKISERSGLSTDELFEVLENQPAQDFTEPQAQTQTFQPTTASNESKRLTRMEVEQVIKSDPDAGAIRDTLFAESLASGRSAGEIWESKYKPLVEVGRKAGVEKLQQTKISQPVPATSTASESDLRVDPRSMTKEQLEALLPKSNNF